ncbi:MAG TPA: cytochrome P460 family protein [Burkholderiales bacterium]|nr:cytochrome P460 family protein [Burkholderiales bacterium]
MNKRAAIALGVSVSIAILSAGAALSARDKYSVRVPGGLAFSEFKGYEGWSVIAVSQNLGKIAVILGNPVMIEAFRSGIPANGKPFPDGAKMAKVHWNPKTVESEPGGPVVPDTQYNVDFMAKDHSRFADSGGWGWASFDYDAPSDTFTPATSADKPPQGNDAKCGFACHTIAKGHDFVFTNYAHR